MYGPRAFRCTILGALASLVLMTTVSGQESLARDPLALVKRLVDPAPLADLAPYQGKDADLSNMRANVEKAFIKANSVELIEATGQGAVVAVEFDHTFGERSTSDFYLYLSDEPDWKVVAHVIPRMPPWAAERRELGYIPEEEIRARLLSQGASAKQIAKILEMRKTAPLYRSDREVKAFFDQNRARLDELRDKAMPLLKSAVETEELVERKPEATEQFPNARPEEIDRITALLKETATVWMGNTLFDQTYGDEISRKHPDWRYFNVVMWGFPGGALGFFWKSENAEPPSVSPNSYLIVRSLGGGWYLYRTAS